jgi:NADH-quinone oxidoreductase subunit N
MNWSIALPEIVLSCLGMVILVYGVFAQKSGSASSVFKLCSMLTIGAMVLTAALVISSAGGLGYSGLFLADGYSVFVKLLVLAASALGVIVSLDYNEHENLRRFEFPVLMLYATVGMMVMASASNMMSLYMGVELQSLSIYVLAAFARDDLRSSEAGLKYFVLGALASGLLLYGISLIYGFSGSMAFDHLAAVLADPTHASTGLVVGIVFVVAGLAFKISAVPFHMWTPDVYEGAPTPVTAFMATAPKVAAVALFVRVLISPFGHLVGQWQQLIVLVSMASMVLGALAAIGQGNIKRLMAYSSIGHMGYLLVGLAAGTQNGVRGVLIYLLTYVFTNAGMFACIIAMRRKGRAVERIADLGGLSKSDPGMAAAITIFLFSMAGIPPFSGFIGKYFIFGAAIQANLVTLAVVGMAASAVSAFYYIRIIKVMYFDAAEPAFDMRPPSLSIVAGAGALFTLVFFLFPAPVVAAAEAAAKGLFG